MLWQLPPTLARDDERLAAALGQFPAEFEHAVEFRHESWFAEPVMQLLREHRVALVIADRPEIRPFQTRALTAPFVFARFHYGSRGRRGNYAESELREWAGVVAGWASDRDVYGYFNNDWEGFAPHNAKTLKALLQPAADGQESATSATGRSLRGPQRSSQEPQI
jgi:uncharacterized protein YecE (DUF72 family)